ncbi:MAG TPA: DUF364 domain-containing protein [Geobacteraceae bacterium]|nr:DUF364 domain-containing protein [Geobacteraceae bacterium]
MDILEQARQKLSLTCGERGLDPGTELSVRPLSPDEAIGPGSDGDFVIRRGKESVIEASFLDARGQAFTDEPSSWRGDLAGLIGLDLGRTGNRAVFTAGLNAVLRFLQLAEGTVHCMNDEPSKCGLEMTERLHRRFGVRRFALIGLQPAILKEMVDGFGKARIRVADLNPDNIGKIREEIPVSDGEKDLQELVQWCEVGLATGSSVVNGTINGLIDKFAAAGKPLAFFGNTISGVAALTGLEQICPFGR